MCSSYGKSTGVRGIKTSPTNDKGWYKFGLSLLAYHIFLLGVVLIGVAKPWSFRRPNRNVGRKCFPVSPPKKNRLEVSEGFQIYYQPTHLFEGTGKSWNSWNRCVFWCIYNLPWLTLGKEEVDGLKMAWQLDKHWDKHRRRKPTWVKS